MRKRIGEGAAAVIISIPVAILTVSAPYLSVIMFMFILSWLISRFRLHYYIMALIALFLPFSFEILISPGTFLLVPTEPLIIVVLLTVIWDILYDPVLLRKLFQLESKWILPLMIWFVITLLFSTMK
ncbi:MAG TPA: hypothetical protein VHI78_13175, partial [Bacteroidales bacterium]|nr:hypothetical protein [Bacteroidales bacterium]